MEKSKKKIAFVASESKEAQKSLSQLKEKYEFVNPDSADVIIALGGDGTILKHYTLFSKKNFQFMG
jgi:NAD+ kinase